MSPVLRVLALTSRLQRKTGATLGVSPDRDTRKMRLTLTWATPGTYSAMYGGCDLLSLERALREELEVFRNFRRSA